MRSPGLREYIVDLVLRQIDEIEVGWRPCRVLGVHAVIQYVAELRVHGAGESHDACIVEAVPAVCNIDAELPAMHIGRDGDAVGTPIPPADGVSRRFRSGTEATLRRNLELTEIVEGQLRRGCLTEFLVPREIPQHTEAYALTRRGPQRLLD